MSGLIKPFGTRKSSFIPPKEAMRRLDEMVVGRPATASAPQPAPAASIDEKAEEKEVVQPQKRNTNDLFLEDLQEYGYRIQNVRFREQRYMIDWQKESYDAASAQDRLKNIEVIDAGWQVPSAPLYAVSLEAVYLKKTYETDPQQKKLAEEMWRMFIDSFKENWFGTSTYVKRRMFRDDLVIHDKGLSTEWQNKGILTLPEYSDGFHIMSIDYAHIQERIDKSVQLLLESKTRDIEYALRLSPDFYANVEFQKKKGIVAFGVQEVVPDKEWLQIAAGYTGDNHIRLARAHSILC